MNGMLSVDGSVEYTQHYIFMKKNKIMPTISINIRFLELSEEFESVTGNEPSMFESLTFYCNYHYLKVEN